MDKNYKHIIEIPSTEPSTPYLYDCDVVIRKVSEKQKWALQGQERDQKALAGQCGMQKASKTRGRARAGAETHVNNRLPGSCLMSTTFIRSVPRS